MIKKLLAPFKVLPLGYYRLFLLFWAVSAITCLAMPSNIDPEFEPVDPFIWLFFGVVGYYLFMRIVLWVYNGFKQDKNV